MATVTGAAAASASETASVTPSASSVPEFAGSSGCAVGWSFPASVASAVVLAGGPPNSASGSCRSGLAETFCLNSSSGTVRAASSRAPRRSGSAGSGGGPNSASGS
ncbi:Uncharacterised protein [Mycobacteroides abscessus subsp. abscessus]|nr:Uncharacterised protein [Mycobacteroides abscessus subsp. abscessus]